MEKGKKIEKAEKERKKNKAMRSKFGLVSFLP